jgi:hypothetical protein
LADGVDQLVSDVARVMGIVRQPIISHCNSLS